jgi:hypothetical protein
MSPAERQRVHRSFERFQSLPPAQREQLKREWRQLSPEQRQQRIQQHDRDGGTGTGHPPR